MLFFMHDLLIIIICLLQNHISKCAAATCILKHNSFLGGQFHSRHLLRFHRTSSRRQHTAGIVLYFSFIYKLIVCRKRIIM